MRCIYNILNEKKQYNDSIKVVFWKTLIKSKVYIF